MGVITVEVLTLAQMDNDMMLQMTPQLAKTSALTAMIALHSITFAKGPIAVVRDKMVLVRATIAQVRPLVTISTRTEIATSRRNNVVIIFHLRLRKTIQNFMFYQHKSSHTKLHVQKSSHFTVAL